MNNLPNDVPEIVRTTKKRNSCDGATDVPGGAALGHPRVWLEIDEKGYVECGYCDKRFVLIGGPADIPAEVNNIEPKLSDPENPASQNEKAV